MSHDDPQRAQGALMWFLIVFASGLIVVVIADRLAHPGPEVELAALSALPLMASALAAVHLRKPR